jgi:hypothetical protein
MRILTFLEAAVLCVALRGDSILTASSSSAMPRPEVATATGQIDGRMIKDLNGNGVKDAREPYLEASGTSCAGGEALSGLTVNSSGPSGASTTAPNLCSPDGSGPYYHIANLAARSYTLSVSGLPSGWTVVVINQPSPNPVQALLLFLAGPSAVTQNGSAPREDAVTLGVLWVGAAGMVQSQWPNVGNWSIGLVEIPLSATGGTAPIRGRSSPNRCRPAWRCAPTSPHRFRRAPAPASSASRSGR